MSISITRAFSRLGLSVAASNSVSGVSRQYESQETELKSGTSYLFDGLLLAQGKSLLDTTSVDIDILDLGTYDVGNGPGRDSLGLGHTNVKAIMIRIANKSTSTGTLTVDATVANGWAELVETTHTLAPGDEIAGKWVGGKVIDATNKVIRLTASGGDLTYDFELLPSST